MKVVFFDSDKELRQFAAHNSLTGMNFYFEKKNT